MRRKREDNNNKKQQPNVIEHIMQCIFNIFLYVLFVCASFRFSISNQHALYSDNNNNFNFEIRENNHCVKGGLGLCTNENYSNNLNRKFTSQLCTCMKSS